MTDDQALSDFDRQIIGASKRITIPLGDRFILRNFADLFRGLATTMDHYSRLSPTPDLSERLMMLQVTLEIDRVNRMIKQIAKQAGVEVKEGRPRLPKTEEHSTDKSETVNMDYFRKTPHIGR